MSAWYPDHPTREDARVLRQEEDARTRELSDLPDLLTDEEYEAAESAWQGWLAWLNSPGPDQAAESRRYYRDAS